MLFHLSILVLTTHGQQIVAALYAKTFLEETQPKMGLGWSWCSGQLGLLRR